jgi:hypothetical protein
MIHRYLKDFLLFARFIAERANKVWYSPSFRTQDTRHNLDYL